MITGWYTIGKTMQNICDTMMYAEHVKVKIPAPNQRHTIRL